MFSRYAQYGNRARARRVGSAERLGTKIRSKLRRTPVGRPSLNARTTSEQSAQEEPNVYNAFLPAILVLGANPNAEVAHVLVERHPAPIARAADTVPWVERLVSVADIRTGWGPRLEVTASNVGASAQRTLQRALLDRQSQLRQQWHTRLSQG
jgi:hypothetical protein